MQGLAITHNDTHPSAESSGTDVDLAARRKMAEFREKPDLAKVNGGVDLRWRVPAAGLRCTSVYFVPFRLYLAA